MRILYVVDEPHDADLTRRWLSQYAPQFTLETVATQGDAMARINGQEAPSFDLVLTGLRLPDGDGLSLLSSIRERALPLAVVVITGTGDEQTADAVLRAGADGYVAKRNNYLERLPLTLESALYRYRTSPSCHARPLKVLYAEHDLTDIGLTRRHMSRHASHIHLHVVTTGADVLDRLSQSDKSSRYDVILLDDNLPVLSALDVLKELRQGRSLDVPVVLVTGQGNEEVALQAIKLGASSYVIKQPGYLYQLPGELETVYLRTELIREQAARSESEARLLQLAEHIDSVIFISERFQGVSPGRLLYISPAFAKIWGVSCDSQYRDISTWRESLHPEDCDRVMSAIGRLPAFEFDEEFRIIHPSGETRWVHMRLFPIPTKSGQTYRIAGIADDITERKRTQEAVQISEERFAKALHRVSDALSISRESDSRIIEVNEAWVKLFGYSREEAVERTPLELNMYVNEADRQSLSELISRQGFVRDLEMEMYTKAREVRQVSVSAETTVIGGEPCFITITRDLTEQRRTEEALFKAEAELAHVDRVTTMGELAASIAHEVNQPLTAVIATADLCYAKSQSGKADAKEIQEMLSEVVADARRVNEIISRIRGLLHKGNPVKIPLAINDIIWEVCAMLMSELTLKRIKLKTELEADLPLILGDRIQLQQVLLNLIENGVEAMLGIKDRPRELLIKSAKNDASEVMVSVRDSGSGVGPKDLERIFEPFYTTKATGMGMGLSISRRIIKDHEGKMWAVPNAGCGLTFHFSLPSFSDERRYSW
jgi:PAS domain S-box-containing protein